MDNVKKILTAMNERKFNRKDQEEKGIKAYVIYIPTKPLNESLFKTKMRKEKTESALLSKIKLGILNPDGSKKKFIDFKALQDNIVKVVEDVDVFISFCHDDSVAALELYDKLKKYCKPFADPLFWGSIDQTLLEYDDEYSFWYDENDEKEYDYDKGNHASSVFHAMLADSIKRTIQNSKYFVFLASKNSMDNENKTISPWLYLENSYCQDCRGYDKTLNESWNGEDGLFKMPLNFSGFKTRTVEQLINEIKASKNNTLLS